MGSRGRSVVVVGAGHNGLVCAAHLARAGLTVTVLEQAERPGGAVVSEALTLPGFVHDVGAGFLPLTLASPAFDALDVRERLSWVNPDVAMAHPADDGTSIALHRDLEATVASLSAVSPAAGRGWREIVSPVLARRDRVIGAALTPAFPSVRDIAALGLGLRRDGVELARLMLASSATFGHEILGDERAAAWFSGSAMHADLTPGSAGGAALSFALKFLGHAVGWGFPLGGAGRLTDALVARVRELGGTVSCGQPVESVVVGSNRARGVRVKGGDPVAADAVVLALTARPALRLLPEDALPHRLVRRLSDWRYGIGVFKVDYALAGPVPWLSADARAAGVVHVVGGLDTLFLAHQQAGAGRVPDDPCLIVGQHSLHDPSRAPAGRHTLYVYMHVPSRLDVPADEVLARIERRLEHFAPGFGRLVLARRVHTPEDLERDNPNLVGGDLAGGSCELDQQLIFRPAPELFRGRTPLRGLYLAGISMHPGAGVHGVPGAAAARAVLADMSPRGRLRRAAGGALRRAAFS